MMYPMAPSPSSSGISRSIITRSGCSRCTFRSASMPLRAVPTTVNSPLRSRMSESSRRKNGLSSATRTVRRSEVLDTVRDR